MVEESDIIRKGLSAILAGSKPSVSIEYCADNQEISPAIHKFSPRLLLVNPATFEQYEKQINSLKEKYGMLIIGLVYSF